MARKSKLQGSDLAQFIKDRDLGIRLADLSVKYGLTQARLSQIYNSRSSRSYPASVGMATETREDGTPLV